MESVARDGTFMAIPFNTHGTRMPLAVPVDDKSCPKCKGVSGNSLSQRERVPPIARWAAGEGYRTENSLENF